MSKKLFEIEKIQWKLYLSNSGFIETIFKNVNNIKEILIVGKRQNIETSRKKNKWKLPIRRLQIRISSPNQIRSFCLRKNSEGFLIGRVWNASTVNYKDLKPISGGLFCESTFGSTQLGSCVCNRIRWISYPKLPKKLGRTEILTCPYCLTRTIYPAYCETVSIENYQIKSSFFSASKNSIFQLQNNFLFKGGKLLSRVKSLSECLIKIKDNQETICKCKKTKVYIYWFFSIFCICKSCITLTRTPYYGAIHSQ